MRRLIAVILACAVVSVTPSPVRASSPGVLILAHGGSAAWNERVLGVAAAVDRVHATEVAFGMASRASIQAAIDRLTDESILRDDLEDAVRLAWDHLHIVPVDQRCLDRAASLARLQPVRLTDAIHLAAAERLPPPVRFITFDPVQIGVALGLGLDVVSS